MKDYILFIDNGHCSNTPEKCSGILPDRTRFREYSFCHEVVDALY